MIVMNVKLSHCAMNKICVILSVVLALSAQQTVFGQPFEKAEALNLWNRGRNVTGIRNDSVTMSYAEIYGGLKGGDFHDSYEASDLWNAGIEAKTTVHNAKFSMNGSFSFDQATGKNMCGSMFINPGYYPVDVLEFTPGKKSLQTYSFSGGIATEISGHWRIGGKIDFESANYSKRKDLRHTNYMLDMTIAPSVMWFAGDIQAGLSYVFEKSSESIKPEQIGTATADSYYAFLDKGLMTGTYEVWNGSGVHLYEAGVNKFPVKELSNGAALQFQWKSLYADAEWLHTEGEVGEKSFTWYKFPGNKISARLGGKFVSPRATHLVNARFSYLDQDNRESVINKVNENGVTTPRIYGYNKIFERRVMSYCADYRMFSNKWEAGLSLGYNHRQGLSSLIYPYKTLQNVDQYEADGSALYHLSRFDIGAKLSFFTGSLTESEEMGVADSGVGSKPYRLADYFALQKEYLTADRLGGSLSLRYNIIGGLLKGSYAEISGSLLHGFDLVSISGSERLAGCLKIGYNF